MISSISSSDALSINQMFKRLDADNSGTVDENELKANRSSGVTEDQASQIMQQADQEQDGFLTQTELANAYQLIASRTLAALLENQSVGSSTISSYNSLLSQEQAQQEQAFTQLDLDSDGLVTEGEFMASRPDEVGTDQTSALWTQIAANSGSDDVSGGLTVDQFVAGTQASNTLAAATDSLTARQATLDAVTDLSITSLNLSTDNTSDLFALADSDQDGMVSRDDFLASMPGTVSASQANALWTKIAANSGAPDGSGDTPLAENQFVTGFNAIYSATQDEIAISLDDSASDGLMNMLTELGTSSAVTTSDTLDDPLVAFANADSDGDGYISKDDFLSTTTTMSAAQASQLWTQIVNNSGAEDTSYGLTSDQFMTGYENRGTTTTTVDTTQDSAINQLKTLLQSLRSGSAQPFNLGTSDPTELFQQLDQDQDGTVTEDDMQAIRPSSVTESQVSAFWAQITSNSGSTDSLGRLSQDEFVNGVNASPTGLLDDASISQLLTLAQSLRGSLPQMYSMGTDNQSDMFAMLDGDADGTVTQDDFLNNRPSTISLEQATATWNAIVLASDSVDASGGLRENEFVTGLNNLGTATLDRNGIDRLMSLLQTIDGNDSPILDLGTDNPSDIFSLLDTDADGMISQTDLQNAKTVDTSDDRAAAYWSQIVANGGADSYSQTITEDVFVTGYNNTLPGSLDENTIDQLLTYLDTVGGSTSSGSDETGSGTATISLIDTDNDGLITQQEFSAIQTENVTSDQVDAVWNQIVSNSGAEDTGYGLTTDQFVAGFASVSTQSLEDTSNIDELISVVDNAVNQAALPYEMAANNPSDLFAASDNNQDGIVTRDDFLSTLPAGLTTIQAANLWEQVAGNSGVQDTSAGLTESQFVQGYNATPEGAVSNPSNYATISQLLSFLDTVRSDETAPFDLRVFDASTLYSELDTDNDDAVTRQDFVDSRPSGLTENQAGQLWDLIAANSGNAESGYVLSREDFVSGFDATETGALEAVNTQTLDRLTSMLQGVGSQTSQALDSLYIPDAAEMLGQLDGDSNSTITREELLSTLGGEIQYADSALSGAENSQYLLQRLVSAYSTYQSQFS